MARAVAVIYPYPVLAAGRLKLEIEEESIPESATILTDRSLDVREVEGPFTIAVKVAVESASRAAEELDLAVDDLSSATRVVLVGTAYGARLRENLSTGDHDCQEPVPITLDPDRYRGLLEIRAYLIYRDSHNPSRENCRCAVSEPLSIYFDEYDSPPGSDIQAVWADFRDPTHGLTGQADQLFSLKPESDPPLLYLNTAIDQFHPIMMSAGTHGNKARIRDTMCHRIGSQVWHILLSDTLAALNALASESPESSGGELIAQMSTWREKLVRDFAGEQSDTEPLPNVDELIEQLQIDREQVLVRSSADYIQQLLVKSEPLEKLVRQFLEDS